MSKNIHQQNQKATWEELFPLWFVDKVHRILEVASWTCLCEARVGCISMTLTPFPPLCINTTIPFNSHLHFRLSDWLHQKNESEVEKQNPITFNFNLVQGHHFTEWTTNIQVEEGCWVLQPHFIPDPYEGENLEQVTHSLQTSVTSFVKRGEE